jgi:hypothetical protein
LLITRLAMRVLFTVLELAMIVAPILGWEYVQYTG